MSDRLEDRQDWLPAAGLPGVFQLVSAAPASRARTVLSTLRNTLPSPRQIILVVLGIIAAPFLVIFTSGIILAIVKGGLGY